MKVAANRLKTDKIEHHGTQITEETKDSFNSEMICGVSFRREKEVQFLEEDVSRPADLACLSQSAPNLAENTTANTNTVRNINRSFACEIFQTVIPFQARILTPRKWLSSFDDEGRLAKLPRILKTIISGVISSFLSL